MLVSIIDREIERILPRDGCINIKVTAVYDTTLCGYCGEKFITILNKGKRILPMSVVTSQDLNFKKYRAGDFITIGRKNCDNFIVGENTIIMDMVMPVAGSLDSIEVRYRDIRDFLKSRNILQYGILPIISKIEKFDNHQPFCEKDILMKNHIAEQISLILHQLTENQNITAKNIIGYGIGLTPSADDFLLGILSVLDRYNEINRRSILSEYIRKYSNTTTEVSSWMLEYGCNQKLYPHIVLDYFIQSATQGDFLAEFLKHGSSSGIDMLCGILCGLNILRK